MISVSVYLKFGIVILPYLFLSRSSEKVMLPKYQTCTVDLVATHDIFLVQINLSFWPTLNQQSTKLILLLKTSAGLKSFKIPAIILICDQTSISIITSVIKMIILITINNVTTITYHHHHDHHFCKELGKRNAMWNIPAPYLIIVADAADAVSVNFFGWCKFLQI